MTTIYILHGWTTDPDSEKKWKPFIDDLKKLGFESKFLKIPGLDTPLDEIWQLQDFVNWLKKQMPENEKVVLLGHSFGGQIATRFAVQFPAKIKSLILVDSSGIRNNTLRARFKRLIFLGLAKSGKTLTNNQTLRNLLYKLAREADYKNASPTLRKTMANIINDHTHNDLTQINCKTLIIWGKNDKVTPLFMAHEFNKKIPDNKLVIIENARHSPQFTHSKAVTKNISQFLFSK